MSVNEKMTAIADAIRAKTGGTDPLSLDQMAIDIASITGGASLDVIAAPALPSAVVENQVVVITSTTPGTFYLDTNEPTGVYAGDVWIQVGMNNYFVNLSDTIRNGVIAAVQYDSGWKSLDGYIGVNGAWQQFSRALPPKGTPLSAWTWEEIITLANSTADASEYFAIGDSKDLVLSNGDTIPVVIGDFYHNNITGENRPAALAFTAGKILSTTYAMNSTSTNVGGWGGSLMCTTHMPAILNTFPTELLANNAIKFVDVVTTEGNKSTKFVTTSDRLRLHSITELGLTISYASPNEGTKYDYYTSGNRVKTDGRTTSTYWTRSPTTTAATDFCHVSTTGTGNGTGAKTAQGVAFAFDI